MHPLKIDAFKALMNTGGNFLRFVPICLFALALAVPAYAGDEIEFQPLPEWLRPYPEQDSAEPNTGGAFFVRYSDVQVRLTGDASHTHTAYRIQLLTPEALSAGNVTLVWNPDSTRQIVHHLRIYREGEVINVLDGASFSVFQREGGLERSMLDGLRTAALQIPGLRVGDEIEFAYTTIGRETVFPDRDFGALWLSHQLGAGQYRLSLEWDEGEEPKWQASQDIEERLVLGQNRVELSLSGPDRFVPPDNAPGRYRLGRAIEFGDFEDWGTISRRYFPLYEQAANLDGADGFASRVDEIAANYTSPENRAKALLALTHETIRYVYTGMNGGNLRPATAGQTWDRRFGDCKGMTALLLGGLKRLGIEAEAVLVASAGGDELSIQLPNPGAFDHVLVRAKIGSRWLWLDGTRIGDNRLLTDAEVPYWWVLPIAERGSKLQRIDFFPMTRPSELTFLDIDATAGFDEPAKYEMVKVDRGDGAIQLHSVLKSLPSEHTRAQLKDRFSNGDTKAESVDWKFDPDTAALSMHVTGTMKLDWDVSVSERATTIGEGIPAIEAGTFANLTLPQSGFYPPERRERPEEQMQDAPFANKVRFSCAVLRLKVPELEGQHWGVTGKSINSTIGGVSYYRVANLSDGVVELVRASRTIAAEISSKEAKQANSKIDDFDNSTAKISTWPGAKDEDEYGIVARLPDLDRVDWITEADICQPQR